MEGRDVDNKQQWRDWRSLRGTNWDRGKNAGGTLKKQTAGAVGQEGPDPDSQVVIDPFASEVGAEDRDVNIGETSLNIEEV